MSTTDFTIAPERPQDAVHIAALLEQSFGPGRFARSAYRLREGRACVRELSFVSYQGERLAGSVRFWPVLIGDRAALLLGPIAVNPQFRGQGAARALIEYSCAEAARLGHKLVILVGDLEYYGGCGFKPIAGDVQFPASVDIMRVLVRPLAESAEKGLSGRVSALQPTAAKFCGFESVMVGEDGSS